MEDDMRIKMRRDPPDGVVDQTPIEKLAAVLSADKIDQAAAWKLALAALREMSDRIDELFRSVGSGRNDGVIGRRM